MQVNIELNGEKPELLVDGATPPITTTNQVNNPLMTFHHWLRDGPL